jgi:hypothetical protein
MPAVLLAAGIGLEMEGAMQHAPQFDLHVIVFCDLSLQCRIENYNLHHAAL